MNQDNVRSLMIGLMLALAMGLVAAIGAVAGQDDVCPDSGGWTKIDSGDLSLYPVDGATQYCFKAGSWAPIDSIPEGGFGQDGSCNDGIQFCDLSHWSYFVPDGPTATPDPTDEPTPTETDEPTPTETEEPTPTEELPTPTPIEPTPTETEEPEFTPTPTPTEKPCRLIPQYRQYKLEDFDKPANVLDCYVISLSPPSAERSNAICSVCTEFFRYDWTTDNVSAGGMVYLETCTGNYVFIDDDGTVIEEWNSDWFRPEFAGRQAEAHDTRLRCPSCDQQN